MLVTVPAATPCRIDAAPRVAGLLPTLVVDGIPTDPAAACAQLGLDPAQLVVADPGDFVAALDVPAGTWRLWLTHGVAVWTAARNGALPRVTGAADARAMDLVDAVRRLHRHGRWCLELRLLDADGWGPDVDAGVGLRELVERRETVAGISAVWDGGGDGAVRVELYTDGTVWAADAAIAERWALTAFGLADV